MTYLLRFMIVLPRDFQLQPKLFWLQRVIIPFIIEVYHSSPCNFFNFSLNQVTEVVRPPRPTLVIYWQFQQQTQGGDYVTSEFLTSHLSQLQFHYCFTPVIHMYFQFCSFRHANSSQDCNSMPSLPLFTNSTSFIAVNVKYKKLFL